MESPEREEPSGALLAFDREADRRTAATEARYLALKMRPVLPRPAQACTKINSDRLRRKN